MKKLLICSTAMVAVGLIASPASAADKIKLGLGGYMNQWVGTSTNDESYTRTLAGQPNMGGFDVQADSEVHIGGSTTLDNGLTVTVKVEMEAAEPSNAAPETVNTDESWVSLSSATLGTLILGSEDSAASLMHNTAPDVGMGLDNGDFGNWILIPGAVTAPLATESNPGADAFGVSYQSPSFSGVSIGLTYKPDVATEAAGTVRNNANDAWTASIGYSGKVGDVSISADIYHGVINDSKAAGTQTAALDETGVGLSVGFGGFTIGGAYKDIDQVAYAGTTSADGKVWIVGGSYASGPASVSVGYLSGQAKGLVNTVGKDKSTVLQASGAYDLGGGVGLAGSVFKADFDDETNAAGSNNTGWAAVAGVTISF